MEVTEILAAIDAQISKLQQARDLLAGVDSGTAAAPARRGPGRPRKAAADTAAPNPAPDHTAPAKPGRKLSPEGRQRIAEAMKRRWAERKQA